MSDRPSQQPTGKVRPLPEIPKAPRSPQVERSSIVDGAIEVTHDEAPPGSTPTSPPPPVFTELQRISRRPSPVPPPPQSTREEPRSHDSRSFTLPGPYAVPRLLVDAADLSWFEIAEESRGLVALVDGTRSIADIARERGLPQRETQLRIADLRSRGVVEI